MDNCIRCEILGIKKEADQYIEGVPMCTPCVEEAKLELENLNLDEEE